jgi:hypothetical protein
LNALAEALNVEMLDTRVSPLMGAHIESPLPGDRSDGFRISVKGWAASGERKPLYVEIVHEDVVWARAPINLPRPDVSAAHPAAKDAARSGFAVDFGVLGLPDRFKVSVRVVCEGEWRCQIAALSGRRSRLVSGFDPTMQPLLITGLGRSGTTALMRLVLSRPAIVGLRSYPYEFGAARYWMHMVKVLSEPADPLNSVRAENFEYDMFRVVRHPFISFDHESEGSISEWFSRDYIPKLIGFCQRACEDCYATLARHQGQAKASYFAEKFAPTHIQRIVWEIYPKARELILIRDPRDIIASVFAFNTKRGRQAFGREGARNDEEYIERFAGSLNRLANAWRERAQRAHLVRYEELVRSPRSVIERIFDYIGQQPSESELLHVVESVQKRDEETRRHMTSKDVNESIGRWRRDLPTEVGELASHSFASFLKDFSYE